MNEPVEDAVLQELAPEDLDGATMSIGEPEISITPGAVAGVTFEHEEYLGAIKGASPGSALERLELIEQKRADDRLAAAQELDLELRGQTRGKLREDPFESEDDGHRFKCSICGGIFVSDTNAAAIAEKERDFPGTALEDCDEVCDPCYQKIKPSANPEVYADFLAEDDLPDPFESEDDRLLAGQIVEDALAHEERERRRRMRPIEDAAALDPADPDYQSKLKVLVEEAKANLAADPVEDEDKPTLDQRWRAKRLAKMEEKGRQRADQALGREAGYDVDEITEAR